MQHIQDPETRIDAGQRAATGGLVFTLPSCQDVEYLLVWTVDTARADSYWKILGAKRLLGVILILGNFLGFDSSAAANAAAKTFNRLGCFMFVLARTEGVPITNAIVLGCWKA